MSAFGGASYDPRGWGTRATMDSRISSMPIPSFADAAMVWAVSIPMMFSICSLTRSTSAPGRSILLRTGITSRSFSTAR